MKTSAASDRDGVLSRLNVSRETTERLEIFVALLGRWRHITDLISNSSFSSVWTRHIEDSAQLVALAPFAKTWLDLGTGAGLPGLIVAILMPRAPDTCVHLVESDKRKCAFLQAVISETGASAIVHPVRIEALGATGTPRVDVVTARALAPFPRLLEYSRVWLEQGSEGIFMRGRNGESEVRTYLHSPDFAIQCVASRTDPEGLIVRVSTFAASSTRSSQRTVA